MPVLGSTLKAWHPAASWECWDAGSIPARPRELKIWRCRSCGVSHHCGLDLLSGLGMPSGVFSPWRDQDAPLHCLASCLLPTRFLGLGWDLFTQAKEWFRGRGIYEVF